MARASAPKHSTVVFCISHDSAGDVYSLRHCHLRSVSSDPSAPRAAKQQDPRLRFNQKKNHPTQSAPPEETGRHTRRWRRLRSRSGAETQPSRPSSSPPIHHHLLLARRRRRRAPLPRPRLSPALCCVPSSMPCTSVACICVCVCVPLAIPPSPAVDVIAPCIKHLVPPCAKPWPLEQRHSCRRHRHTRRDADTVQLVSNIWLVSLYL